MEGREFYDRVVAHPALEWLGAREAGSGGDDEVIIGQTATGVQRAVSVTGVLAHPWEELEAVLTGTRKPTIMTHFTRIVGYFSRVQNWNRSKLAELADRQAGDYALPERAEGPRDPAPARARAGRGMAPALV